MASLLKELPSVSTLLSAYASLSALTMLIRTILNEMIPKRLQDFLASKFSDIISSRFSSDFTFVIEERWQAVHNETFRAVEVYLPTRIGPSTTSLLIGSNDSHNPTAPPKPSIPVDSKIIDEYQGIHLEWSLHSVESKKYYLRDRRYFNLTCKKNVRERILKNYFPQIARTAQSILNKRETLSIYTYNTDYSMWESTVFRHPSTFDTLAMEPELKQSIIEDLDAFVQRKEFFESVGRAWKRGYLLYGPPGTGKSSLVAAIANYMRYNIYDLQFQSVKSDADLRRILTSTTNRSVLLIEDIDCSTKVSHDRGGTGTESDSDSDSDDEEPTKKHTIDPGVTLSGLLNFIDGLWSCCGDERIIIFTTNHKEKLDPALLRPGRMDFHMYMGYCTPFGFKKLATTYLGIKDHDLFGSIENLMKNVEVTPAEVAQQLMKSDDPKVALESLIEVLNTKSKENEETGDKNGEEKAIKEVKKEKKEKRKKSSKKECKKRGNDETESEMRSIYLT